MLSLIFFSDISFPGVRDREYIVFVPRAGLGVEGAALGTGLAEMLVAIMMTWYLCRCSKELALVGRPGSSSF